MSKLIRGQPLFTEAELANVSLTDIRNVLLTVLRTPLWERDYPGTLRTLVTVALAKGIITEADAAKIALGIWEGPNE